MTSTSRAYLAFAAFGAFWGAWGAAIPRVRAQAGVADAQLGIALLFVAAGALPAMLLTGRLLDRCGMRGPALALPVLGLAGLGVALMARDVLSLCVSLTVVGAASGAGDVAINTVAGRAEQETGRPVIFRSHGVFSLAVVLSSVAGGGLARFAAPLWVGFGVVVVLCVVAGVAIAGSSGPPRAVASEHVGAPGSMVPTGLLLLGVLGALGFAAENAHQSWGAIFLEDVTGAGVGTSALAPASFAATVALTRFVVAGVPTAWATRVLLLGATGSVAGAALLAASGSLGTALAGLVLAAAGTAVLLPTLLGILARTVQDGQRGRAVSRVTTTAYVGFLLGPVYVGALSDAAGLRAAMLGVAALGLAIAALLPLVRPLTTKPNGVLAAARPTHGLR